MCLGTTRNWTGASTNAFWGNPANWEGSVAPQTKDDIVFKGAPAQLVSSNNFANNFLFNSVTFATSNFVVFGNPVTLDAGITAKNAAGTNVFVPNIILDADQTFLTTSNSTLIITNGVLNLNGHTLTVDGIGTTRIGGLITGTGNLIKSGTGTLRLELGGNNTFAGDTTVNDGTMELAKQLGLAVGIAIPGPLFIGGHIDAGSPVVRYLTGDQIADTAPVFVGGGAVLDLNNFGDTIGSLVLADGTVQTGSGTLILGGDVSTKFGDTIPSSGRNTSFIKGNLSLGTATRTFDLEYALEIPASISGGANAGMIKTGTALLFLESSNSFSGPITNNQGILAISNSFSLGATSAVVAVSAGATLGLQGTNIQVGVKPLVLNGAGPNGFSAALISTAGTNSWAGDITLPTNSTINVGRDMLTLSGVISGPSKLTVLGGTGVLKLAGSQANTYSGGTEVDSATLLLQKSAGVNAIPGALVIGDGSNDSNNNSPDTVRLGAAEQIHDHAAVTVNSSGLLDLAGFSETIGSLSGPPSLLATNGVYLGTNAVLTTGGFALATTYEGNLAGTGRLVLPGRRDFYTGRRHSLLQRPHRRERRHFAAREQHRAGHGNGGERRYCIVWLWLGEIIEYALGDVLAGRGECGKSRSVLCGEQRGIRCRDNLPGGLGWSDTGKRL